MDDKGGQPERWSDDLWKAYVDEFKEADQSHIQVAEPLRVRSDPDSLCPRSVC